MIKHKRRRIIISIAIVLGVVLVMTLIANRYVKGQINTALQDLPKSIKIDYNSIRVNVWTGNLEMKAPKITILGNTTSKSILHAQLKTIEIKDISYYDFLVNDEVTVDKIILDQLVAKYKHNAHVNKDEYSKGVLDKLNQIINVETVKINNADILVSSLESDSTLLSIPKLNFELNKLQLNPKASKIEDKIAYNDFQILAKNLKWGMNEFDDLFVDSILITNNNASFSGFEIKTKYNKAYYSNILKTERDHFNLKIEAMTLKDMDFGFINKQFYLTSKEVDIVSPEAEIYRDKLVADDTSYKPMYGAMLRDLDFKLGLKAVKITNGKISYLEKVNSGNPAGRLDFVNLDATILNLGNSNQTEETKIKLSSTFMENSILNVDWNFKVADNTDYFEFKADLSVFNADQLDQFTKANLNIDLNGELQQTYFTISGNKQTSRVDLKLKYDDFEVAVLKKNGKEKNRFLSKLVNLIVSDDSEEQKHNFRYGQNKEVERDISKSVFNFVWLNVKQGLLGAMTGDGLLKE
jgi:hypothetical protein